MDVSEEPAIAPLAGTSPRTRRVVANFLATFRQNVARFRLYRRRSLQVNTRSAAFFKIYQIILILSDFFEILQIL